MEKVVGDDDFDLWEPKAEDEDETEHDEKMQEEGEDAEQPRQNGSDPFSFCLHGLNATLPTPLSQRVPQNTNTQEAQPVAPHRGKTIGAQKVANSHAGVSRQKAFVIISDILNKR